MTGIVIGVSTSEAVTGTKNLSKALSELGKQGVETEKGLKKVSDEAKKKLAADDAAKAAAKLGAALGSLEHSCNTVAKAMMTAGERANATNRHMANFSGGADGVTSKMATMASKIGMAAAAYVTFQQAVTTASNSFAAFREYESALTDMGRVTNESLSSVSKTIKSLPAQLGDSTSMMRAYYQVMSAGVTDSAKALDLLTVSAKASKAAHVEQEQTVKGLTKLMAGYDGAIKSAAEASDLLFRIDNLGQTSFAELVPVIGDIAGISSTAGLKFQEMASGMAVLTQTSGSTSEAATKLKAITIGLYKPTENMEKVIKALGYSSGVSMVQQEGLAKTLQILKSVSDTAGVSLGKLFESSEALVGIAALSANGWSTYLDTLKKMGQGANETEAAYKRWMETSQQFKDTYDNTIKTLAIEFGEKLAPIMTKGMQDFVDVVVGNKDTIITTFGGISAAIEGVVKTVMVLMKTYQALVYNIAAGVAVAKGEMDFGDWATASGPDELAKRMKTAGDKINAEGDRIKKVMKTADILHGENTGTIPELKEWFPDTKEAVSGANQVAKATDKASDSTASLNKNVVKAAGVLGEHKKKLKDAGDSAARYAENAASFYENTARSIDQLQDSLTGGTEKNANRVDDWFKDQFAAISKATIGAKGDVEAYKQAWVLLEKMWPGIKMLAVTKDLSAELKKQAQLLKDIADATGDPAMMATASVYDADAWYADKKAAIDSLYTDEAEKAAMMAALQAGYNAKLLQGRADAYAGVKAVSSEYWDAEKKLIEANLATVKARATDETAYKIYAAQQWDEFYKAQMEQQAATAGSFAETLAAKWSLAFGGYKSETTRAKDSWNEMSDGIIKASEGMIDGIAGGFGDMIRNIGNGTASIEDLWKNMLSRMLDMFASFVEDMIKSQLKKMLGGMFSGSTGTDALSSSVSSISNMRDGGTGSSSGFGDILGLGKSIGKGIVDIFSSGDSSSSAFINKLSDAAAIEKTVQAASPSGYTALTSGASSAGALATSTATSATSVLGTIGTTLGVLGAIGGVVGLVASLFGGQEEEVKKTASGYNVGYKGGKATASGVDFYSDGSTVSTGASDPDIQKKISDSFRNTAESLSDFAEQLGFAVEVLDGFEFPTMDITEDQLDGYIRNGQNQMAFQGLMEAGLRGAFDAVLRDGEIYVDEFERLSTSFSTVSGGLEAYGYELADVAMISQENIDALRIKNTEVAEGTAQALATMAAAMGATSDLVAQVASDTSIASAALTVTDEQLSNILEADYASKLLDAVGGQDAFDAMMGNLTKNIFDTVGALAENLDYYNAKAATSISKLDDSGVTIENFWEKFDEAIKGGLTVDQFEDWGKASTWVNQIDTVTEAMEDWANSMNNLEGSLEARKAEALGMSDQAKYIQLLYTAENELYEARKNNYDEAIIAKIQEVQQLEQARQLYEMAKKSTQGVQDLNIREMEVTGNPFASIMQAYYDNGWELQEAMESGLYSDEDIARLAEIQKKEIDKLWEEIGDAMTEAATSAHSRMLKAAGKTDEAAMYDFQISAAQELEDALESGLYSAESYSELMRAIALEADNLAKEQERQRKKDFVDAFVSGPLELEQQKNSYELTVLQDQISVAEAVKVLLDGTYQSIESAYNTMNSLATSLRSTLQGFRWNDNLSPNTATQTFAEQAAYYQELLDKVAATDKSDMDYSKNIQDLQSFAGTYLESAKGYYGASQEYWRIYEAVTGKLEGLQVDTQTDSDIYREQLLTQKEIVNNSQLQIDALTLANTQISEQLSAIALMQATDELAYKQEAVAQNMTQSQLDVVINSIGGASSQLSEIVSSAYLNSANQIFAQQALYEKAATKVDVQIGELTLQSQLSQLAINNQEYLNQLIAAESSLVNEGLLNDEMQTALLTIAANYAVYQASLAESSLNSDATSNYYLSEMTRVLTGGFGHWVKAGGYAEAIYNIDAQMLGYTTGIYTILGEMNGKMGTSTGSTSNYLGGFAGGGDVSGPGWFMAGEAGPEPVLLKGNGKASVTSNSDFTGSIDANTEVTAAGLSALLAEMRAMRKELAQIRSTRQLVAATPARN